MKYVGSKAKFVKDIIPILQECIVKNGVTTYWEPFVGGGNMLVNVACDRKIGSDKDELPIALMRAGVSDLTELLSRLPKPYPTKEHYIDVLKNPHKYDAAYRGAVLLFGSYNARVYGGYYGAYAKTKDGAIRNYYDEALRNFVKQVPLLQGTELLVSDYKDVHIESGDAMLIYCDPPYGDTVKYSEAFDTETFWKWVREMSKMHYVLVSEYNAPDDFVVVWQKDTQLSIDNREKHKRTEHLFTFKDGLYAQVYL